jgi:hypothetical protein
MGKLGEAKGESAAVEPSAIASGTEIISPRLAASAINSPDVIWQRHLQLKASLRIQKYKHS